MRRVMLVVAGLLCIAPPVLAQNAEEIVARYIKTTGGMEKIQALTSLRRVGKYTEGGGFEALVVSENKRPNLVRQEFSLQGLTQINAYDGTNGWKIVPWGGKKDVEPLGEEERKQILEESDFDGPLVNYKDKGNKVEYMGTEPIEGTDAYKLKVTLKNGDVRIYYMDTDFCVPIKIETKRFVRGAEREYETTLGDYEQVAGVYLPFAIENNDKGSPYKSQITIDWIDTGVDLADAHFQAPKPGEKPKAYTPPAERKTQAAESPGPLPVAAEKSTGPVKVDSETISGLGARNIGSAAMSGRIAAIDAVHEGQRLTVYIGAASGGVWKSVNGGTTYKPVFDKQPVQSIGAVTVDPKDPKVIWVGTGESWVRNSVSVGDGVYKSVDGGDNWTNMGLKESEHIAKVLVDPTNTNTVYVAAVGKLWSDSRERGVYKSTDGGKTWSNVLQGSNPSTGCSMISMDRQNPKTIYAGMWDFRRRGWTFRSGGDSASAPSASGLFKTVDGGATWTELDAKSAPGLPTKPWGRVAVTVAPSNPKVVYAFIEAELPKDGLYRSDDGGATWRQLDRSRFMVWRPFYFANLIVDPKDENKIYKPNLNLIFSNDGGKSFSNISGGAHGDFHDLWIDPQNTDHLIAGDDGGVWYSYDGGNRWWKADNLPVSQFYHVSVDMAAPYHVYGGLQDNSSWIGDSRYPGGITNSRWENLYGGDGFWVFPDPTDPDYLYAEYQGGGIARINRQTHETRNVQPLPQYKEGKLRYNWNTPIHVSRTQKGTVYLGSQFLFRSRDAGQTWKRISPDLTTNDPMKQRQEQSGGITVDNSAAEMHTTIYAICESPKNPQVVWVGTDDGNVQVTQDGGVKWTNVVGQIRGVPANAWVSSVEAGHFAPGTAYATFDAHTFGDMTPYVYKTTDFGKTWTALTAPGSGVRGYAHVVKEDLVDPNLLFVGTEMGLWISLDGGTQWAQFKGGELPNVAVRDLAIHPRDNDLVIGTHGRGIWIVDDITPLRALTSEMLAQEAAFIPGRSAVQNMPAGGGWSNGDAVFVGANPSDDAVITYYQRRRHIFGNLKIEVLDLQGKLLGTIPSSKRRGLNRATWGMRLNAPKVPPAATAAFGAAVGPRLMPGTYTVRMTKDQKSYATELKVVPDARANYTPADRKAQFDLLMKLHAQLGDLTAEVERINGVRLALDDRAAHLPKGDALVARLKDASGQVDEFRKKIVATKEGGAITGEERLRENLADLYGNVSSYEGRPTQTQVERADVLAHELADVAKDFDAWMARELDSLNSALVTKQMEPVKMTMREPEMARTSN